MEKQTKEQNDALQSLNISNKTDELKKWKYISKKPVK